MTHRLGVGVLLCLLSFLPVVAQAQTITFLEQGAPATVLLDGSAVGVRVVDPAADFSYRRDGVQVTVTSSRAGDSETLSLVETGTQTGVFEGVIELEPGGSLGAPTLATATSPAPPSRDTVHASYNSATATASLVGSSIRFLDLWDQEAASVVAGFSAQLRVRDELRNNSNTRDSVTVTLTSQVGGDSETVTLQETGVNTGLFEGAFTTTRTASAPGDGQLGVTTSDVITATLPDGDGLAATTVQVPTASRAVLLVDGERNPTGTLLEGAPVHVFVVDPGAGSAGSVTVQAATALSGDSETLTLMALGGIVFEGEIPTFLISNAAPPYSTPGDGTLQLNLAEISGSTPQRDAVTVTYGTASASAGFIAGRIALVNDEGQVTSSYLAGSEAHIRLELPSRNTSGLDQVPAMLVNEDTGAQSFLTLTEDRRDSGVFVGSVVLSTGGSGSGNVLPVQLGHRIHAVYDAIASPSARVVDTALTFLDEWGEPTDEIVEYGAARVRLQTIYDGYSPGGGSPNLISIEVRSLLTSDMEGLTLSETHPGSYVYEGSIPTQVSTYASADDQLQVVNSGFPDYRQDQVTGRFFQNETTARTVGARLQFLDAFGRTTSAYAAGETVRLRIVDHHQVFYMRNSFEVTLVSLGYGDSETVTVQRTSPTSAIYEGTIPSSLYGARSTNGTLAVDLLDQIEVRHVTGFSPIEISVRAAIESSSVTFVDAAGQPAASYLEGTRAYLRVVSAYHNSSPSAQETVQVQLVAELSQDAETLVLTETGLNTGVFLGSIPLRSAFGSQQPANGILETTEVGGYNTPHEFDSLRATFISGPGNPAVARIGMTASRTWFANAAGAEVLSYPIGTKAYVRVEDHNLNDPSQWDRLYVQVSVSGGDSETLQLLETARDSGIFAGSIDLVSSTMPPLSGSLLVAPGDQIEAVHQDGIGFTASSAVADIGSLALEFIDETGAPTAELLERDDARVRMFSVLQNTNPAAADSVVIELRSLRTGDLEQVSLTETGADTSVFEGSIPTLVNTGYGGDGVLQTNSSGYPDYAADQITARYGSDQVTARMAGARVRFVDADGREVARFVAGETVRMRVVDHNRNMPQNRDTLALTLYSRDGGDMEALTLQETGFNTAVFEGSLPSAFGGAGTGNGRLDVFPNDLARAEYQPSYNPHLIEAQADVTGNAVRFIDAAGRPVESYLESSRAYLRVVSAYRNQDPSVAELVTVQIVGELSTDAEEVILTETGASTGVFEGSIQLRLSYGGAYPGNGILETIELGHPVYSPPHQMDSLRATYTDPAGTSEALAGLTGSRTWFADAAGAEVQSYPVGGTAYVRVEDQNSNRPGEWDRAFVELRSSSGDLEYLDLSETSRDSGIFAGSIELTRDTPQTTNGRLYAAPGDQITVTHQDSFNATASSDAAVIESVALEFIDASGEPTSELLEGGVARVRLFSLDNNANPGLADTTTIVLASLRSNDEEFVILTETGPDTHLFEGSIQLTTGSYAQGDGQLGTSNSGFPEYQPDEVTARSGPIRTTARVLGARVVFFDGYGRETATFAAGERVRVRVIDHNRNTPQSRESIQVPLTSRDGGDSELLTLQETGFDTAVFEGSVASSFGGPNVQGDGQIRVFPDDQVEASHVPAYSPVPLVARAAVTGNALLFIDAAGQPAASYLESSRAYVRLTSAYRNQDPYAVNQVPVQIVAELSMDSEELILNETGPNTGVFEGSIQMRLSYGGAYPSNGILETVELGHPVYQPPHEFDTLRATVIDPTGTSVARIGLTGSRTWFADASGVEVLSYPAGGTAYVRVEDQNYNRPGEWDRVWVELHSSSGDLEYLELGETSRDSGIFAGSIGLTRDTPQQTNGRLSAAPGDQIDVTHQDATNATASSAVADIEGGALEFIDASGEPTVELLESGTARVRLFSVYNNSNPGGVDTATVLLSSLRSGDEEMVQLTETGFDTNVFEGSIQLTTGSYAQGDGQLGTVTSGFPEYLPEEVTARSGPIQATARVTGARISFFDGYGRETASFAAGETVRVRVVDHNRNTPQNRESVQVPIASRDGGDSELLTLQETGFNTAVFEGSVPTRSNGPNTQGDAQLRVVPGDQLQADYVPAFSPNPLVARAAVAGNAVLFIDAAGQPASTYLESSRAYVRVVSTYGNYDPSAVNQVPVQIVAQLSTDSEELVLTETGPNTGTFEGSIPLRLSYGGAYPGNGILETIEVGHPVNQPPHEFDTLRATFNDPTGTSVARITLTGSRTWFADANGEEVSSYAAGGTAYVRVEDQNYNRPGEWDRVWVELHSSSGDLEYLELGETSRDSGIFAGSIELTRDTPQQTNGRLSAAPGDQIDVTHQDAFNATSSSATAGIEGGAIEFIDASGEPTVELLESGTARVRLFSVYNNSNPAGADTATVLLSTLRSADEEMVQLTETGFDTNVFEGSIQLTTSSYAQGDGQLGTVTSGFPEYLPEEVTAGSGPIRTKARVLGARIAFIDGYGRETASFAAGETVRLRVVDHNRNTPQSRESVQVPIASRDGGDSELLTLQETGFNTAVFEGSVPTHSNGPNTQGDAQLRVVPGDQLQADYVPSFSPNPIVAQAAVAGNAVLFIDAAGQPASTYLESSRAYVRVMSSAGNYDPSVANQVTVQIVAQLSTDSEELVLTETGPNTGVFEGSIPLRLSFGGVYPANGFLETIEVGHPVTQPPHEFDTLRATFNDPTGTAVARITLTGSRTWFADANGEEVSSYAAGGTAYVRVEDQNYNRPGEWDRVWVELHSSSGDLEYLELGETSRDSGIFAGSIELTRDTPQQTNGRLSAAPGDQIDVIHQDAFNATSSSAMAMIEGGAVEFIDASGEPTVELLESGTARVRLFSVYNNSNPGGADTATILLSALRSGDEELVQLTETGANTNVFEGSIQLTTSSYAQGDGQLGTVNSGFPEYLPEEVTARSGPIQAKARVMGARIAFFDGYGRETASFAAGATVHVRVVDHNRNTPLNQESVQVPIASRDGGDSELLTLQETGLNTAVFEGSVASSSNGPNTQGDGQLRVVPGDQLQADYVPSFSPNPIVAQAAVAGNAVLFIDAAGQPASTYLESSRAYVRVTSSAGNYDPSVANQVPVQIVAQLSNDSEELILNETGPNTGIFEGSIPLRLSFGGVYPANGFLETIEVGHPVNQPPHEFDTLRATFNDPTGTAVARITLTGSRTWFADATGEEALSYAAGSTAYVRVEDQNYNTPGQLDRAFVELRSSSGDLEYLELSETSPDSGIFAGSIQLARDTPQNTNGQLYAAPGEQITVIHQDAYGATASSAVADIVAAQITFINLRGQEVASYAQGSILGLRVIDPGRNFNPGQADSFQDNLRSLVTNDAEVVTLTETGPDTGIFEGTVPSVAFGSPGADGVLVAPPGQVQAEHMSTPNPLLRQVTILTAPAPVAGADTAETLEDTMVVIPVVANDSGAEPLFVVAASQPAHGTAAVNDMSVAYTPAAGYVGLDTFTYLIVDNQGGEAVGTVTVTITPSNRAPVANPDTTTTLEDQAVIISVLANDTDPNNDALDVTAVTQGTNGTVVLNANDTVTYAPSTNFNGADSFTYTISDGNGGTATGTVTITITSVNDAPVANPDSASASENGSVVITVLGNDTDVENDTLNVTAVTQGAHGAVVINANNTVTYTPAAGYVGSDTFTYTISDGNGGTATASVSINVDNVNDAPVANADAATLAEDASTTIAVLANDTDLDNDTLDVTAVTQGTNGTVVLNANDTVTYTPNANFNGTDAFTYTISDGNGGTTTGTVTITITSVNDAPVANPDSASASENGSVVITVLANDTDVENDTLNVTAVTQGAHGTVVINANNTVTYTPAAGYVGADTFTYTISDGNGGTATASVSINVDNVNDAPVANADAATLAEDASTTITVLANDTDLDNDTLDVTAVTQGTNGTVVLNANDTVTYTPNANFNGTDAFTYTISDGNGGTASATVNVTITAVNDAPVANPDSASVAENGSVNVAVLTNDTDVENDTLNVTAVTQGAHGAVVINANSTVTYTPAAGYVGPDTFTYTISDGNGGTATASVSINVDNVNDAPVANADAATVAEDASTTITVLANDTDLDNDTFDVTAVTQGTNGTVVLNANDTVTYTPNANFNGTDSFTYTISDGNGGTASATVNVTITPVNDVPVANPDSSSAPENGFVNITVLLNDTDVDNDTLSVTAVTQGAHGAVTINTNNTVKYTPAAGYVGADTFTYTIGDGNGGAATASVSINVNNVNDAPVANADAATLAEDTSTTIAVLANDTDPDNDVLSVASVTQGTHGTVTINPNKTVTYTPVASYNGSDAFTYTAADGNGGTATASVTVTITAVNDAPVAVNDTASTTAETLVAISVLANDVDIDGPSLSIASVTQPAHGTVTVNANQTINYTPASAYVGADSFTYTVSDGAGGTATATVNLTVNAPVRIATNLQVLYELEEGSGTTVTDTSGVGTPLNLTIGSASAVSWVTGGLSINAATLIQSAGAATKVISACQTTNAITIEAWIEPTSTSQTGPIATVSQQSNKQNFSLNQNGNRWNGTLRTSNTNQSGSSLSSATGTATLNLAHVVYTRDASGNVRIYVNGVQSASTTLAGNFSSWTSSYKLGLVNELNSGSPWRGRLYLVAIYNRALSSTEVRQNWLAGE